MKHLIARLTLAVLLFGPSVAWGQAGGYPQMPPPPSADVPSTAGPAMAWQAPPGESVPPAATAAVPAYPTPYPTPYPAPNPSPYPPSNPTPYPYAPPGGQYPYPPPSAWTPPSGQVLGPEPAVPVEVPVSKTANWVVGLEALWLERTAGSSVPLGYTSYNPGVGSPPAVAPDKLYSDDVLFPLAAGMRVQIGRRIDDQMAIEASYFGMQSWSVGRAIYGDPAGDTVLAYSPYLQTAALLPGGLNNFLSYSDSGRVNNAELNIRMNFDATDPYHQFGWLWGVRYFNLSDKFTLSGSDLDFNDYENVNYDTMNNAAYGQLGLEWTRGWDRFTLTTEGKVGLGANCYSVKGNNLNSSGVTEGSPAGFVPFTESTTGTDFSAIFEISLLGRVRMTDNLWLRLGYQAYCMTGLALGARQLGTSGLNHGGTVELDGFSVGLEANW